MSRRDFVGLSVEELFRKFQARGLTEGGRDALLCGYRDKWLRDWVVVQHTLYWSDAMCLSCAPNLGQLVLFFRPGDTSWHEPAAPLLREKGRTIGVVGQIQDVKGGGCFVELANCELLEPRVDLRPFTTRD